MKSKEIRSKITDKAKLELSIEEVELKKPVGNEVHKMQASPINHLIWSFIDQQIPNH